MDLHPRKRKTSEKSCFLCQKDLVECDEKTPCSRCIIKGVPQMCYSSNRQTPSYPFNNGTSIRPNITTTTNSSNNNNNNYKSTTTTTSNNNNNSTNRNNSNSNNSSPISSNNNSNNNNNNNNNKSNTTNDIVKSDQDGIANLLISELRELKDGQKKIYEELVNLKTRNEKLEIINESLITKLSMLTTNDHISTTSQPLLQSKLHNRYGDDDDVTLNHTSESGALSYPRNNQNDSHDRDYFQNIFMVVDLSKLPPVVLNCSKSFCNLLGYTQNELIGKPWTEITHPNLIEKTMNLFQQYRVDFSDKKTFDLAQVYKHRDGSIFSTIDSHTLISDADNTRAVCDLVNIRLLSNSDYLIPPDILKSTVGNSSTVVNHDVVGTGKLNSNRLRLKTASITTDESPPGTPDDYQMIIQPGNTTTTTSLNNNNIIDNNNNNNNNIGGCNNYYNGPKIYEQPSTPISPITPITPITTTTTPITTTTTTTSTIPNNNNNNIISPLSNQLNDFNLKLNLDQNFEPVVFNNSNIENNEYLIPSTFTFDPNLNLNINNNINNTTTPPPPPPPSHININNNNSSNNNNTKDTNFIATSNNGLISNNHFSDFIDSMIGDSNNPTQTANNNTNNLWSFDPISNDWAMNTNNDTKNDNSNNSNNDNNDSNSTTISK